MRQALATTDDRNLTVHTYNEVLANVIFGRLPAYAQFMDRWLSSMEKRQIENIDQEEDGSNNCGKE